MVKIKNANIFGRIGTGIGKGLADQVPKEIERTRLASGLDELGKNSDNLNPFQQFSKLSAIPGITPQMVQSGAELLKHQGNRQAYARKAGGQGQSPQQGFKDQAQGIRDQYFPGQQTQQQSPVGAQGDGMETSEQPQINPNNPLAPEAQSRLPWSQERRDQDISNVLENFPNITLPEAVNISADNERRELALPEGIQKRNKELDAIKTRINEKIDTSLMEKLQKSEKKDIYSSLTGESINNIRRGVERDLRTNPKASEDELVNKWTDKALENEKDKTQLSTLGNKSILSKLSNKGITPDRLKTYAKSFADFGNSEEYYNLLKSAEGGFEFSPQVAAYFAFPRSKNTEGYISKIRMSNPSNSYQNSIKYAEELGDLKTNSDSWLSIAHAIKEKDPMFNENVFFQQLRDNQDSIGTTKRQRRELAEGESDVFPNWGDMLVLPSLRGKI